jgi:hypothetical protein
MAISTIGAMDNGLFLAVGAICLVLLAVAALRRSQLHRVTARELTRTERAQVREESEVQHSMDDLLTQLEEVSRRIDAQVDSGLNRLEAAIKAADARIARLDQATPSSGKRSQPDASRATPSVPPSPPPAAATPPPAVPPPAPPSSSPDQRRRKIYELADAGAAPLTIADKLHIPLGEVELILNLRKFA